jgi:hypothetical protein
MKQEFSRGNPGVHFKNGRLYCFGERQVMVLSAGTDPRCWIKTRRQPGWHSARKAPDQLFKRLGSFGGSSDIPVGRTDSSYIMPDGQLVMPFGLHSLIKNEYSLELFMQQVPVPIRRRLIRFKERRWHLYNLMARVPGALDLCDSNPAIAYMLASNWVFHQPAVKNGLRAARALVFKPQRNILQWLGFPPTESVRKILRKIEPESLSIPGLLRLRTRLRNGEVVKLLAHLPCINAAILYATSRPAWQVWLSPALLQDIARNSSGMDFDLIITLRDTFSMGLAAGANDAAPRRLTSIRQLRRIHDELSRLDWAGDLPEEFPSPPLAGGEGIEPICTRTQLRTEGREQNSCVHSYSERIHAGTYYVYRAHVPGRVTIGIKKTGKKNRWVLDQIYQSCNRPVPDSVRRKIQNKLFSDKEKMSAQGCFLTGNEDGRP